MSKNFNQNTLVEYSTRYCCSTVAANIYSFASRVPLRIPYASFTSITRLLYVTSHGTSHVLQVQQNMVIDIVPNNFASCVTLRIPYGLHWCVFYVTSQRDATCFTSSTKPSWRALPAASNCTYRMIRFA